MHINKEAITMDLSRELRVRLLAQGASKVGFAKLSDVGSLSRKGFPTGVVIGMALRPAALAGLENGPTPAYYHECHRVNEQMDCLARLAASILRENGYASFARTQDTMDEDARTLRVVLPHKMLATRAGFGWIGKCDRLVTTDFGAALRLTSVLTDAPLDYGTPVKSSRCGDCQECRKACPARAISGRSWSSESDRDEFFNAFGCRRTEQELSRAADIPAELCGICRAVCPYTRQYLQTAVAASKSFSTAKSSV